MHITIKINQKEYLSLIADARFIKGEDGPKRLESKVLDLILNRHLAAFENQAVKICHKSSKLMDKPSNRRDSNHLTAYGFCNLRPKCPVSYAFNIKNKPNGDYVDILVDILNKHEHESVPNQVRGQARINLGAKIMAENGGSAYEARLLALRANNIRNNEVREEFLISEPRIASASDAITDAPLNIEVPSASVYRKCKSAFNHKGVPTNDWQVNFHYVARTFEATNESFVHSFNTYPQLSIHLQLQKALNILSSIPSMHRIGHFDSTGGLVKIPQYKCEWLK